MRYIKLFENFINEELVTGLKTNSEDSNIFLNIFNSDPLKLREFIQSQLNLQNLKFIAGGGIGLAFLWKNKVLKFTTDLNEKRGVEKMIELSNGDVKIPGFAKYYWIKEVSIPETNIKKFISSGEEKIKKKREFSKSGKSIDDDFMLTPEEEQKRKSSDKIKKAYIICMEKIDILEESDKDIAHFIFLLTKHKYLIPETDNKYKLKNLIIWLKSDEEEYNEEDFLEKGLNKVSIFSTFNKGLTKKSIFSDDVDTRLKYEKMWNEISTQYFIDFSIRMLNIYKSGNKIGIPTSDIHENNLGYRDGELVAFDCM